MIVGVLWTISALLCFAKANDEARLMKDILAGYTEELRLVRPVINASDSVVVNLGMNMMHIADFRPRGGARSGYGTLITHGWLYEEWIDEHVAWDRAKYNGIDKLSVPFKVMRDRFWNPNIVPWDGAPTTAIQETDSAAFSSGLIRQVRPMLFHFECSPAASHNYSTCEAKIGPWVHDVYHLDIGHNPRVGTGYMKYDPEWIVLGGEATRQENFFPCCPEPYASVTVTINIANRHAQPAASIPAEDAQDAGDDAIRDGDESMNITDSPEVHDEEVVDVEINSDNQSAVADDDDADADDNDDDEVSAGSQETAGVDSMEAVGGNSDNRDNVTEDALK